MFTKKDQMLIHKTSLNTVKKITILQSILSHNGIKWQAGNIIKCQNIWKLNKTHLNNLWAKEEITREIRKYS